MATNRQSNFPLTTQAENASGRRYSSCVHAERQNKIASKLKKPVEDPFPTLNLCVNLRLETLSGTLPELRSQ